MNVMNIIIIGLIIFLIICYIIEEISDYNKQKIFKENIKIGTKICLKYFKEDGSIESIFKAKVVDFNERNQAIIEYSDGSRETDDIVGFVSLYSKGWRIVK